MKIKIYYTKNANVIELLEIVERDHDNCKCLIKKTVGGHPTWDGIQLWLSSSMIEEQEIDYFEQFNIEQTLKKILCKK